MSTNLPAAPPIYSEMPFFIDLPKHWLYIVIHWQLNSKTGSQKFIDKNVQRALDQSALNCLTIFFYFSIHACKCHSIHCNDHVDILFLLHAFYPMRTFRFVYKIKFIFKEIKRKSSKWIKDNLRASKKAWTTTVMIQMLP